ncbi:MAG: tripartite tricarboxylate transporter substrate-binding protein, partial [Xanthobacteraceae bacterium]
ATHLGCVLLNYLIGVDITHVPYRGTGPAMQDLQGGRIDYLCEIVSTAKPQIDGGKEAVARLEGETAVVLRARPWWRRLAGLGAKNLVIITSGGCRACDRRSGGTAATVRARRLG